MQNEHVLQILLRDKPERLLEDFDDFAGALYLALSRATTDRAHFEPVQGISTKYGILILSEFETEIRDRKFTKKRINYDPDAY